MQSPIAALNAIGDGNPLPGKFRFTATGRLLKADAATTLHFGSAPLFALNAQRTVCVNPGGRARIAGDGNAVCGPSQ